MEIRPKQPTIKGPSEMFTGDVFLDRLGEAEGGGPTVNVAAVHFTPGARTAWHAHEGGQTLYVTEGEGRVQTRGGEAVTIRAGDVVRAPSGEWHWHGAAPDHFMTHLSLTTGSATWGEHVAD